MLPMTIARGFGRTHDRDAQAQTLPLQGSVVFAVPDFDPSVGGTTRQARLQAEALARRGHRVLVVTRRLQPHWPAHELIDGLEVVRVGSSGRGAGAERRALGALAAWLLRHRREVGILQVVMWPDAIVAAAAGGLVRRTAILWAIRGEIIAALDPGQTPRRRLQAGVRRALLARAEHVTLTPAMASEFEAVGFDPSSTVIPVPVDRDHFRPATPAERAESRALIGVPPDAFTVVYVGHLQERKAVDRLIAALGELRREVPGAHLLIVGGGRAAADDTEAALRRQVEAAGLKTSVSFCGVAGDPRPHLWAADVLALASVREGMPNSLLEGLACGLPCVAPASAGGDEVLDRETGIVPPSNDPDAIAAALQDLAGDEERRRRMGETARHRSERYDVERVADDYEHLYRRMVRR
jgi:glycosyltransferase involved in cell wall biosynthesis